MVFSDGAILSVITLESWQDLCLIGCSCIPPLLTQKI